MIEFPPDPSLSAEIRNNTLLAHQLWVDRLNTSVASFDAENDEARRILYPVPDVEIDPSIDINYFKKLALDELATHGVMLDTENLKDGESYFDYGTVKFHFFTYNGPETKAATQGYPPQKAIAHYTTRSDRIEDTKYIDVTEVKLVSEVEFQRKLAENEQHVADEINRRILRDYFTFVDLPDGVEMLDLDTLKSDQLASMADMLISVMDGLRDKSHVDPLDIDTLRTAYIKAMLPLRKSVKHEAGTAAEFDYVLAATEVADDAEGLNEEVAHLTDSLNDRLQQRLRYQKLKAALLASLMTGEGFKCTTEIFHVAAGTSVNWLAAAVGGLAGTQLYKKAVLERGIFSFLPPEIPANEEPKTSLLGSLAMMRQLANRAHQNTKIVKLTKRYDEPR